MRRTHTGGSNDTTTSSSSTSKSDNTENDIFINSNEWSNSRSRQDKRAVRSQAAKASAASRKATIRAKAAGNYEQLKISRKRQEESSQGNDSSSKAICFKFVRLKDMVSLHSSTAPQQQLVKATPSTQPRSILSQGRIDPFQTLPATGVWHASFPKLVDIYLTFVAPPVQSLQNTPLGVDRQLLRNQLWPEILSNSSLFFANLLVAAFYESSARKALPDPLFVGWLRQMAIQNINSSLGPTKTPDNATIAAVSTLAAFELEFGDSSTFDTHMKGLQTLVAMRGGLYLCTFPTVVRNLVLSCGYDLPMFAGIKPYFRPAKLIGLEEIAERSPGPLPVGFSSAKDMCLLQPTMLCLISDLHTLNLYRMDTADNLRDILERLESWTAVKYLSCVYCPVQSQLDDDCNNYAHHLVRAALLCLVHRFEMFLPSGPSRDLGWLEQATKSLRPETVIHTVFAEMGIWALFIICTIIPTAEPRCYAALQQLVHDCRLFDWQTMRDVLTRYFDVGDAMILECVPLWSRLKLKSQTNVSTATSDLTRYGYWAYPVR